MGFHNNTKRIKLEKQNSKLQTKNHWVEKNSRSWKWKNRDKETKEQTHDLTTNQSNVEREQW